MGRRRAMTKSSRRSIQSRLAHFSSFFIHYMNKSQRRHKEKASRSATFSGLRYCCMQKFAINFLFSCIQCVFSLLFLCTFSCYSFGVRVRPYTFVHPIAVCVSLFLSRLDSIYFHRNKSLEWANSTGPRIWRKINRNCLAISKAKPATQKIWTLPTTFPYCSQFHWMRAYAVCTVKHFFLCCNAPIRFYSLYLIPIALFVGIPIFFALSLLLFFLCCACLCCFHSNTITRTGENHFTQISSMYKLYRDAHEQAKLASNRKRFLSIL